MSNSNPTVKPGAMEFLAAMLELQTLDPEGYAELKAECWELVAKRHGEKPPEQRAAWTRRAS